MAVRRVNSEILSKSILVIAAFALRPS